MSKAWPEVPLADIAKPILRTVAVLPGQDYRTIGVKWWGEGAYERETIDGSRTAAKTLSLVRQGDLIINKIWVRHGSTAIAGVDVDGCAASGEFPTFTLDENRVVPRWLHWQTKTRGFWTKCDALSQGTSGKNRIKPELFLTIRVPLPSTTEQQRIVARIEELTAQIEEAKALRKQAVEEAGAVLDSEKFAIFTSESFQKYQKKLKAADLNINRESRNPTSSYSSGTFTYIDISAVGTGPSIVTDGKTILAQDAPSRARRVIRKDDIIISTVRPNLRAFAKVGKQLDNQICSTGFAVLTCGPSLNPDFLLHQFCSSYIVDQCVSKTTGGHYPAINDSNLREITIIAPPLAEQHRILSELDALQAEVDKLKRLQAETAAELDALLPSILDRAFKGEL